MRLNDTFVVAAMSSLAIVLTSSFPAAVGVAAGQTGGDPPVTLVTIKKFTNGQDADVAPGPSIPVGDPVTWTYTITNTGVVPLMGIVVSDDQGVIVNCQNVTSLAVNTSMTCTGVGVARPGPYMNIGTVTALAGPAAAIATDPSHYVGVEAPSEGPGDLGSGGTKVPLCHRNRAGSYELIQVAADAQPAHMAHQDGLLGGPVPNQPGSVFGPQCIVTVAAGPSSE